ncbi:MAG TPA: DUF305 domain-containing protein [Gemmatimonadaceae bacterium]|jgi:uncharacterized protein (DUF305 family)
MIRVVQPARTAWTVRAIVTAGCLVIVPWMGSHAQAISPAAMAKADSGRPPYTAADVRFMQGMIGHHAQAVWMAGLAPTHGAASSLRTLAERIDISQRDEIGFMQRWLRERHETAPDPLAHHEMAGHDMAGMPMSGPMMPGMLTHEQMMQLDEARGTEFDRLFLTFMIQHHQGALTMVDQLFSSTGAGQDVAIFRFASDVTADQTTEIERMRSMLSAIPPRS